VFQGTSQPIGDDCLDAFTTTGESRGVWRFRLPTGQGQHVALCLAVEMPQGKNAVRMVFFREPAGDHPDRLADEKSVRLIVRPDIEDRSFHEVTKAYRGPETDFPSAVRPRKDGFDFQPAPDRVLTVRASKAVFVSEPEWHYMVHRPMDGERGLDPDSDLFSPGYLEARLAGGEHLAITAVAGSRPGAEPFDADAMLKAISEAFFSKAPFDPPALFERALSPYVVRRRSLSTVIAGYPWFLDWGRDTLIFVRGLIAAGQQDTAGQILKQFAAFEEKGTLPNMIRGNDAGNRDTSDAPLWFFTACADWRASTRSDALLDTRVGSRSLRNILRDMARAMIAGTPNGIRVDPDSGLLFSPAHFTWMDTNHPAGTPREGYPVEIQALWWAALRFLSRIDEEPDRQQPWRDLAGRVRDSIADLYSAATDVGFSDCLHGPPGTPARRAAADDALRPNQLFAVTLGAVTEPALQKRILTACTGLLVPGAIRSLADRPVRHRLEIRRDGRLLIDPNHPYQGRYSGDEDTQRKPAYHNGTAWTWVFPAFCEAWARVFPGSGARTALAYLGSGIRLLGSGCIGHLPEILDGDAPHMPKGCDAQAWASSEYYRVWKKLADA
jgi:predicted glycogen debranching enzyme